MEQVRYLELDAGVFRAKNSAGANEAGLSQCWMSNKTNTNGRCLTVVSAIA